MVESVYCAVGLIPYIIILGFVFKRLRYVVVVMMMMMMVMMMMVMMDVSHTSDNCTQYN